jgi:hypothetical protein
MLTEQIEDACIYIIVLVIVIAISTTVMADKSLFAQVVLRRTAKFFGTRLFEAKNAHENRSEVHFNSVFMS